MKIATFAIFAASLLTFAAPTFAQARMVRHQGSRHMMMGGHHSHMMGGRRGRMAGHRTF